MNFDSSRLNNGDLFESLTEREKKIIFYRFGLKPKTRRRTLQAIGKELKITRERVRQIQKLALSKVRRNWRKMNAETLE